MVVFDLELNPSLRERRRCVLLYEQYQEIRAHWHHEKYEIKGAARIRNATVCCAHPEFAPLLARIRTHKVCCICQGGSVAHTRFQNRAFEFVSRCTMPSRSFLP